MIGADTGLTQGGTLISIACGIVAVVLLIWVLLLYGRLRRMEARFEDVFDGASSETMGRMLAEYLTTVRSTAASVKQMKAEHDQVASLMPSVIRHVGLVRFSPFHDTGGDQSFTLALLDGRATGVVVTALHSRTDSRLYAKPIEAGRSQYSLSPEERAAMDRALNLETVEAHAG